MTKIISRERLLALRPQFKKKLVVVGGYYDLLHTAHLTALEAAKEKDELLVVFVNSDANAKHWKGPTRPIIGEQERARLLAALEVVDYVVIVHEGIRFDKAYMKQLQPNILAIGDYPDRKTVKHAGHLDQLQQLVPNLQIRKIPPSKRPTTSSIIEQIKNLPLEKDNHRDTSWFE